MADPIEGVSQETPDTSLSFAELFESQMAENGGLGDDDDGAETEVTTEVTEDPAEGGEVPGAEAATESGTEQQTETEWNWQEYASKPVKVKVAGQEVTLTLQEAVEGGMRQADYTRKTQEHAERLRMAEWAENFQRSLREDPATVLRTLQAAFQQDVQTEIDPYEAQIAKLVETDPDLAPLAQLALQERRERLALAAELQAQQTRTQETEAQRQQREAIAAVEAEIATVSKEFPDFNADVAVQIAASKPGLDLREAWLLHRALNPVSTETAAPEPKKETPEPKTEAKERLQQTTTNTRLQGKPDVSPDDYSDFSELFEIMSKTASQR